jgi:hypothetical protein
MFKASVDRLPYLECSPNGRNGPRDPRCVENNIASYPTWRIGESWYREVLPPERLAALSGYGGPQPAPPR